MKKIIAVVLAVFTLFCAGCMGTKDAPSPKATEAPKWVDLENKPPDYFGEPAPAKKAKPEQKEGPKGWVDLEDKPPAHFGEQEAVKKPVQESQNLTPEQKQRQKEFVEKYQLKNRPPDHF